MTRSGLRSAAETERQPPSIKALGLWGLGVLATVLVVGFSLDWGRGLSIEGFVATIESWGLWGVLASIALMVAHSFVPFPAELLACANGMVYGLLWGTLITWIGAMLGAAIAFGLARKLGRPFVARVVSKRDWTRLDDWAAKDGWQVLLIGRLIPVIAFNLINYAAGLTRVGWWPFLWTTGIGILPMTVLMVALGDNIESLGWSSWLLLLTGCLLLLLMLRHKLRSKQRRPPGDRGPRAP